MKEHISSLISAFVLILLFLPGLHARQKPAITPDDYGQWEQLGNNFQYSADGQWLAVPVQRVNEKNEMRIYNINRQAADVIIAGGSGPVFSDDARWLAYRISEKGAASRIGLMNLAAGDTSSFKSVSGFEFSPDSKFLALSGSKKSGVADLIIAELQTGKRMQFGNVSEFKWAGKGAKLAFTVKSETGASNGVQLYEAATGAVQILDTSGEEYSGLSWRKDADDLAVLRSVTDTLFTDKTHFILAWTGLSGKSPARKVLNPDVLSGSNGIFRISEAYTPVWSKDGTKIYAGIRPRNSAEKPENEVVMPDGMKPSDVQIWNVSDFYVFPQQSQGYNRNQQKTMLAVWNLTGSGEEFVRLGADLEARSWILESGDFAVAGDSEPYIFENMFDSKFNPWSDYYLVNTKTGNRNKIAEKITYFMGGSTTGRYLLWYDGSDFWTYDTKTSSKTNITSGIDDNFNDVNDDHPGTHQRPNGLADWARDDAAVLLHSQFDLWKISPDGKKAERLTKGRENDIIYRYTDPAATGFGFGFGSGSAGPESGIDLKQPVYLTMTGRLTKDTGFARLDKNGSVTQLIYEGHKLDRLRKAKKADRFIFVKQDYDISPDIYAAGADFKNPKRITDTNPFQSDYAWGKSEVISFKRTTGEDLQATLLYPANYDPSKKYPTIVYIYELLSNNVHNYVVPDAGGYYNTTVWTANGYIVLMPDIIYTPREPGLSALYSVEPAVQKVIDMGIADPARVGLIGHSFGGYEAAFIPTQTDIFAAVVEGAGITNLQSFPGQLHWSGGSPEFGHLETGQFRTEVAPWEDKEAYLRNSPINFVTDLKTPMLMFTGDKDGTVDWHQALEFYNYARRAGLEDVVLLVYPEQLHHPSVKADRIDYATRILQWFGHYLKDEPAKNWMKSGHSYDIQKHRIEAAEPKSGRQGR